MKEIRFDSNFNSNEWFIIISLIVGILVVLMLPQRYTKKTTGIYLICGIFFGFIFDHTLSVFPVSYYVINDSNKFELMDFLSHVMYGAYSYLFFYLYDYFKIKPRLSVVYVLVWALISFGFEGISVAVGVFHYENGYTIYYSFVIYLMVISIWLLLHRIVNAYGEKQF
ncbi:hypothetical protein D3C76_201700 [compost metagenome]